MQPMKEPLRRAAGNADVIKCLETWLERAKTHGQIGFIAIIASENLKHVVTNFAGSMELAFPANYGLDTLKFQIHEKMASRHEKPLDIPSGEADYICWDISAGPACFDFIVWLITAEMRRRMQGAPYPLKVGFKMLDSPTERAKHDMHRKPFYENVIFPSLQFVGAVGSEAATNAPVMEAYALRGVVDLCNQGVEVPLLEPVPDAKNRVRKRLFDDGDNRLPITITLREEAKWEHRNSNMTAWLKFAEEMENRGERIIFVRDTRLAKERIAGFRTYPDASTNIHIRQALYEEAKCNCFVSNGPNILATFGSKPYLIFIEVNPMSVFFPETPQWWEQWQGLKEGNQFPWAKPHQRIIWKRDDYENIIAAWEDVYQLLESSIVEEVAA